MSTFLIRAGKDPFTAVSPETTVAQDVLHGNVGNHLFSHTVHKTLMVPGTTLTANATLSELRPSGPSDWARAQEKFDAFVVPLANAFRPQFRERLANLTSFIEGLDMPVVVVGVGAQVDGLDRDVSELGEIGPDVSRFVSAVLDRSASIGVRGEFTRDYLARLGFPESSVDIIGCPSLFLHGPEFSVPEPTGALTSDSPIAFSLTAKVDGIGEILNRHAERYPHLVYVAQDRSTLELMLWGQQPRRVKDTSLPVHSGHPLYQQDRIRLFLDPWTWLDYLETCDFTFGTRFHGNVAGLLARIPAMLLAHDSRTLELADYHAMPYRLMSDVTADVDAQQLYDDFDPGAFNAAYPSRFAAYLAFLERNGLPHIHTPGLANPAFDDQVSAAAFPPAVGTLCGPVEGELAQRLRWLRDGTDYDRERHGQRYRPAFQRPKPPPSDAERGLRRGAAKVSELERVVLEQRKQIARQKEKLAEQRERLDHQAARLDELERRVTEQGEGSLRSRAARLVGRRGPDQDPETD